MRKSVTIKSIILMVLIPVMIVLVSFNVTFRLPLTYGFYFNDTRAAAAMGYDVEDGEVSSEICSYLNNPSDDEFQLYETSGKYQDKIFGEEDQNAMANAKRFLMRTTIVGLGALIASIFLYHFSAKEAADDRDFFLFSMRIIVALTSILIIMGDVLACIPGVRAFFYRIVFQTEFSDTSMLYILITRGFTKTFCVMFSAIGIIGLLIYLYFFYRRYRPRGRIFY